MFSPKMTTMCLIAVEGETGTGTGVVGGVGGGITVGKGVEPQPARKIDRRSDEAASFRTMNVNPRIPG
jgi:hypothetical protein